MTGNDCKNINCVSRVSTTMGVEFTSFTHCKWFRMQLLMWLAFASACTFVQFDTLLTAQHAYHSSACLPELGLLTTARLPKYDCMGHNSPPFFFAFHHTPITLDKSYLLLYTLYATSSLTSSLNRTCSIVLYYTTSHCRSLGLLH